MPIDLYPNIAKVKRNGAYQNFPGFVQQSGDSDIKAMIANSENSTTAQYAHPEGSYFILNDILYKAIVNIAVNDIIAIGTNCVVAILSNDVSYLKSAISETTVNEFDMNYINYPKNADGYFSRTASQLNSQFKNSPGFTSKINFKENTQYTISLTSYTTGTSGTSGNGLQVTVHYTDNSATSYFRFANSTSTPTRKSVTTNSNKTISYIGFEYISVGGNTWFIKEIQIEEGTIATEYLPPITAKDFIARSSIETSNKIINNSKGIDINLLNKDTLTIGKISKNNGNIYSDNNVRVTDFISVKPNKKYIIVPNYYSTEYGIAYFNSSKEYISGRSQSLKTVTTQEPIVVVIPDNVAYIRFNIWYTQVDQAGLYEYSETAFRDIIPTIQTEGLPLTVMSTAHAYIMLQYSAGTYGNPQSGVALGNKMFIFSENLTNNCVVDLDKFTVASVTFTGEPISNHANNASFGNAYYDANDPFPVVYISAENHSYCGIYRITENSGAYTITEVSRIYYPSGSYINLTVDAENSMAYLRGTITGESAAMIKYNLPSNINNNVTFENVQYDETEHPYGYIKKFSYEKKVVNTGQSSDAYAHDSFISNGKYISVGGYVSSQNINVVELDTGKLMSFANLTNLMIGEPEVCTSYDNSIIIVDNTGRIYCVKA